MSRGSGAKPSRAAERFMALEGLRGLAAVSVVVFHFLVLFYPMMYFGSNFMQHSRFEDDIYGNPVAALISGTFSVSIFFVLSGFVLSIGFFQTKRLAIIRKLATKRYLRLMLPALVSVFFALILISFLPNSLGVARELTQSPAIPVPWVAHPNFLQATYEGMIGIFIEGSVNNYNSVLWTMKYEFIGSFIIFAFLVMFGASKLRWMIYCMLIVGLHSTWFIGLIAGMVLADVYVHKGVALRKVRQVYFYIILVCGVIIGAYPHTPATGTVYDFIKLPWLDHAQNQALYTATGAIFVVVAVINLQLLKSLMSSHAMSKLGGYTYSLYLVHQPIIYTWGVTCFAFLVQYNGYNKSVLLAILGTLPVIIIATLLFYRYVELPSMRIASYFERVYSGRQEMRVDVGIRSIAYSVTGRLLGLRQRIILLLGARTESDEVQ